MRMLPPFLSHEIDTQPGTPTSPSSPSSPLSRLSPSTEISRTQRRMSSIHSHLPEVAVDLGYQPRREKRPASSYFSIKDKVLEPRRFFQYSHRKHRLRGRWSWWKILLFGVLLLFVFGYVPFFHFAARNDLLSPSPIQSRNTDSRDQFLLYRIIGNDLPPRHKEGQTLSNLHFILEHEPSFPNTRKIFVLNRISDPNTEAAIIQLLEQYHMEYIRIPFVEHEYQQLDFRLEDFTEPDFLHSDDYRRYSKVSKLRVLDYTYHDKNLYAMNNNGGRNTALKHARTIPNARWIMPFDGNCYLSKKAFEEIRTQLDRSAPDIKHFVVPMKRLLNNSELLSNDDEKPKATEEPQIIFRYDSTEEYNLNMRYGRRSKLELLWRLGALENRRLNRPTVPWEPMERPYSKEKGKFRTIGWVYRLFSGNPQQEETKKEASSIRAFNRLLAIQSSLDSLDESIARRTFRQDRLFLYNETEMAILRQAYWKQEEDAVAIIDVLEEDAELILRSIQEKWAFTPADQNALTQDGNSLPPPESFLEKDDSADALSQLTQNVTILTLANYYLGNEKYGRWAANLVRIRFLNEYAVEDQDEYSSTRLIPDSTHVLDFLSDQGYSFPSLSRIPRTVSKFGNSRRINTSVLTKTDFTTLLDSIRLLRRGQMLTHREYIELQSVMAEFLELLVTDPTGIHLAQMTDYRGVMYDLEVTALAAFTDDVRLFLRVANRCRMRIGKQFLADGSQPYQEASTRSRLQTQEVSATAEWRTFLQYETMNLQYWTMLARGIQNLGIAKDIWHYTAKNEGRISHAVAAHFQKYGPQLSSKDPSDAAYALERLAPLARLAQAAFMHSNVDPSRQDVLNDQQWMLEHGPSLVNRRYVTNETIAFFLI